MDSTLQYESQAVCNLNVSRNKSEMKCLVKYNTQSISWFALFVDEPFPFNKTAFNVNEMVLRIKAIATIFQWYFTYLTSDWTLIQYFHVTFGRAGLPTVNWQMFVGSNVKSCGPSNMKIRTHVNVSWLKFSTRCGIRWLFQFFVKTIP